MIDIAQDLGSRVSPTTKWLSSCVGDAERFLATSWATAPYLSRGNPDRFAAVLSYAELNQLLAMGVIPAVKVRMVNLGRAVPDRTWASEGSQALIADSERIGKLIEEGYTLVVNRIEKFARGLHQLCRGLQAELSCRFGANIYLTPPSSQGFTTHFDDHDVIVLQLAGEKDWQVFDRCAGQPLEATNVALPPDQQPTIAARLGKGDSLYVPRGFVHSAASASKHSLHASIGIYPMTVADLLRHAVNELAQSPVLSRPLPPGFASQPGNLSSLLAESGQALGEQLADSATADELARVFCRSWMRRPGPA
jgi:ribosomal protein L16 Arg81 hydroxylase